MTPEQKRTVKSIILECRKVLESDIEQVLINYGIYIDKPWVNVKFLQSMSEEEENTRKRLEEVIHKLEKSGLTIIESVEQYTKEIVYTYVNRLSALRVLEVRGLIEEVLIPRKQWGDKSYGHLRFYEIAREYCKYQSDTGLAYFIQLIFGEVGQEIGMLFNTQDEYSLINPSSEALLKVIDLLCNQMDEDVWKQDEIIGWIYQYFNEKEKDDVFDRLYKKKQKIKAVDIPAATQLFTPDWIVKWIVDNSLGTLWQEIKEEKREGKKLEEIRLLDPACGSGHFLVQAYDLLYKFYLEEGYDKGEIPYLILQNNLYGIDIDLRAIQLTAMVLFIKAKYSLKESGNDTNTKGKLSVNLVCADAVLLNGARLERLKNQFKKNPTILKMIDIIYEEFKDTRLKGSLIQPEKKLYPLFEEYKDKIAAKEFKKLKKTKKSNQEALVEMLDADSLEEYKSKRNWSKEEEDLLGFLNMVYKEAIRANDITQQMFANEAVKSVKLVDIFMNEYDVVVTNPPYMGKRSMNDKLKVFIDHEYLDVGNDLYAVFISRCISRIQPEGYLFNVASVCVFPKDEDNYMYFLGYLNSSLAVYLLNCINPTNNVPPGSVAKLPVYISSDKGKVFVERLAESSVITKRMIVSTDETSNIFNKPFLSKIEDTSINTYIKTEILNQLKLQTSVDINSVLIDNCIFDEYNLSIEIRKEILNNLNRLPMNIIELFEYIQTYEIVPEKAIIEKLKDILSYFIGCLFGRWHLDGLTPDDDGILPLDASIFEVDIVHRIYECISLTFGDDNSDNIIEEIEQILGKRLDEWLIKDFFKEHIKKYQKRPIYWHICSKKKTFNCFVYYHKLDHDSLYKVKGIYLGEMIRCYWEDLAYYREQILKARDAKDTIKENELKLRCNDLELKLDDLSKLDKELDKILPYEPDIDEGVLKNIIPLEPVLSATVSNEKEREDNVDEEEEE